MCCLKGNASKTKHTQFQIKFNICGKLDSKLTEKLTKNMSKKLVWRIWLKRRRCKESAKWINFPSV